jgi:hypothetical protein
MVSGAAVNKIHSSWLPRNLPGRLGLAAAAIVLIHDIINYTNVAFYVTTEATFPILNFIGYCKFFLFYLSELASEFIISFLITIFPDSFFLGQFDFITFFAVGGTNGALSYSIAVTILCDIVFGFLQWFLIGKLILWAKKRFAKS